MTIDTTRRRLLQGTAAAAGLGAFPGMTVIRGAQAAPVGPTTLITIHLDGGNDTLNTVIPYANPLYYQLRGSLAIPATSLLPIDSANALHPALTGLKSLWDRQRVAIVHGVGYPGFDYSHFQSKQIYWTADPARTMRFGWLGRAVDSLIGANPNTDILAAIRMGGESTKTLDGWRFNAVQIPYDPTKFNLGSRNDAQSVAVKQLLSLPLTNITNPVQYRVLWNYKTALRAFSKVQAVNTKVTVVPYPQTSLAANLKACAQLIRSDSAIRVISLNTGDFDHHVNLLTRHQAQLTTVDQALKAFTDDLDQQGLSNQVLIQVLSDFGRRVTPNTGAGTDHGSAQAAILIGAGVKAGVVGNAPPLNDLIDNGNLPMQVDFRSLYTTILSGWLGINPAVSITVGGPFPTLPVLL